jgi:hypothetical protein
MFDWIDSHKKSLSATLGVVAYIVLVIFQLTIALCILSVVVIIAFLAMIFGSFCDTFNE